MHKGATGSQDAHVFIPFSLFFFLYLFLNKDDTSYIATFFRA